MRCIHKTVHMGEREKDDEEGAKDEEEKEDAEERAVKEASESSSWKECGHTGEGREQVVVVVYPQCQLPRPRPALKKGGHVWDYSSSVPEFRRPHWSPPSLARCFETSSHRTGIMTGIPRYCTVVQVTYVQYSTHASTEHKKGRLPTVWLPHLVPA